MIIIKCDICKEEIQGQQMASNFKYFEKTEVFTMNEAPQEPQIKQVEQMFCEECTDKIKKARDEMVTNPNKPETKYDPLRHGGQEL